MIFEATLRVFWARCSSKMLCPEPHCWSWQHSAKPSSCWGTGSPSSHIGLSPWISAFGPHECPQHKFLATPKGFMSNHNCCKGFHFKEQVEKHCDIPLYLQWSDAVCCPTWRASSPSVCLSNSRKFSPCPPNRHQLSCDDWEITCLLGGRVSELFSAALCTTVDSYKHRHMSSSYGCTKAY